MKQSVSPAVARVLKRLHYPLDVILVCVRWYVVYPLSLRHLDTIQDHVPSNRGGD
jgi:putative transposase